MCSMPRIITIWQATYGRPNFLAVPTAGCLTPRRGSSIQPSIPAASAARFAASKFTHGRATMIFSTGKSTNLSRRSLEKGGRDHPTCRLIWSPRAFFARCAKGCASSPTPGRDRAWVRCKNSNGSEYGGGLTHIFLQIPGTMCVPRMPAPLWNSRGVQWKRKT